MKKIFLLILLLFSAALVAIFLYVNHKPHRDVASEDAVEVSASELFSAYETNEAKANELFLNKTVIVDGEIGEILKDHEDNYIFILKGEEEFFGVKCVLKEDQAALAESYKEGDIVRLKGIVTGGGGGLDVEVVNCIILPSS